jgi:hypothetical protein
MAITLAQAEAKLTKWLAADDAVASGQSFAMGDKTLTLANSAEIRENIDYWEAKVSHLSNSRTGPVIRGVTPV